MRRAVRRSHGRRGLTTVVIVVLVMLNIVLLSLVLQRRAGIAQTGGSSPVPSSSPSGSPSGSAAASPSGSPSPSSPPASRVPLQVMVSAVSADVAWRAVTGTCPGRAAVVERTSDGGRTWREVALGGAAVARLSADSWSAAFVVSAKGPACEPAYQSTRSGSWSSPAAADIAWYRPPSDGSRVALPGGGTARPCGRSVDVVDLLVDSRSQAQALCADFRLVRTTDTGGSWTLVGEVPGATAIAGRAGASSVLAAVTGEPGCAGVAVVRVNGTGAGRSVACLAQANAAPGQVAISVQGSAVWLQAGSAVYVSTDAGDTFDRRA